MLTSTQVVETSVTVTDDSSFQDYPHPDRIILSIIIKFRYNARSDWLKERALSEYRARSVEKWRTNLCFGISTNLTPIKRPLWLRQTKRINTDYMEAIVNNSSVKTVRNLQVMLSFRQTTDENTVIK